MATPGCHLGCGFQPESPWFSADVPRPEQASAPTLTPSGPKQNRRGVRRTRRGRASAGGLLGISSGFYGPLCPLNSLPAHTSTSRPESQASPCPHCPLVPDPHPHLITVSPHTCAPCQQRPTPAGPRQSVSRGPRGLQGSAVPLAPALQEEPSAALRHSRPGKGVTWAQQHPLWRGGALAPAPQSRQLPGGGDTQFTLCPCSQPG